MTNPEVLGTLVTAHVLAPQFLVIFISDIVPKGSYTNSVKFQCKQYVNSAKTIKSANLIHLLCSSLVCVYFPIRYDLSETWE